MTTALLLAGCSSGGGGGGGSALLAPTSLSATFDGNPRSVLLTWTDAATNEQGYEVERSQLGQSGFQGIATLGPNAVSYVDADIACGATYSYRVRAVSTASRSSPSNTVDVSVPTLTAPRSLRAEETDYEEVTLTWEDRACTEVAFRILRGPAGSASVVEVGSVSGGVESFVDVNVVCGLAYSYIVEAIDAAGAAITSLPVEITVSVPPPLITSIVPDSGFVTGGDSVRITGRALACPTEPAPSVLIGAAPAVVQPIDQNRLQVTTPPGQLGDADVTVLTSMGTDVRPAGFTYFPEIPQFSAGQTGAGVGSASLGVRSSGRNLFLVGSTSVFTGGPPAIITGFNRSTDSGSTFASFTYVSTTTSGIALAVSGSTVLTARGELPGGVMLRRSTDGGLTFQPDVTFASGSQVALENDGDRFVLAWIDSNNVFAAVSQDAGATWGPIRQLNGSQAAVSTFQSPRFLVRVRADDIAVCWFQNITDLHVRTSSDSGATWNAEGAIVGAQLYWRGIAVGNGVVHAIGESLGSDGVFHARSTDRGQTWSVPVRISALPVGSTLLIDSVIEADGNAVYIAWARRFIFGALLEWSVVVARSANGGATWGIGVIVNEGNLELKSPKLQVRGARTFVTWLQKTSTSPFAGFGAYFDYSLTSGATWNLDRRLDAVGTTRNFARNALLLDGARLYIAFGEDGGGVILSGGDVFVQHNTVF